MADTTTSKGLIIQDPVLNYDINKHNQNYQKINDILGTIICTSTTRPSTGLYDGMTLLETDTFCFVVRVTGAWLRLPSVLQVSNQAARTSIAAPFDGLTIYRQDRNWIEVHSGVAWEVQGVAVCSSTADRDSAITHPYNGQLAFVTATNKLYQRQAGVWREFPVTPTAQLRQTATQALTTGVAAAVNFQAEDNDNYAGHDNVTNPSRYTAQIAGVYEFNGGVAFAANGTGARVCYWAKNGVQIDGTDVALATAGAGLATRLPARTAQITMAVGDYVQLFAFQDSGGSLNTFAGSNVASSMTVKYVSG